MLQRVFNHTSILKRFSSQTLTLRSLQTLISPTTPEPQFVHAPRVHSSLTATVAPKLLTSRLNSSQAKCFSTSTVVDTFEWKEMDVVSDFVEVIVSEYWAKDSMPVRAFYSGRSVDMVRLQKKYRRNNVGMRYMSEIPPDVVFRFGNTNPKTIGLDAIIRSDIRYMVVTDYGSVILLNFRDSEIDEHLEIVKQHASDHNVQPDPRDDLIPAKAPLKLNFTRSNIGKYRWNICIDTKGLCPRLSATRNLTRVLNRMDNVDGSAIYPPGPKWDVTEDDKAIYLVHNMYIAPYSPLATNIYVEEFLDHSPYVMKNIFGYFRVYRIPEAIIFIIGREGPNPGASYPGYFFKIYLPARIYRSVWDIKMDHVKKEVLKITIPKQKEKWVHKITTKFLYI